MLLCTFTRTVVFCFPVSSWCVYYCDSVSESKPQSPCEDQVNNRITQILDPRWQNPDEFESQEYSVWQACKLQPSSLLRTPRFPPMPEPFGTRAPILCARRTCTLSIHPEPTPYIWTCILPFGHPCIATPAPVPHASRHLWPCPAFCTCIAITSTHSSAPRPLLSS